MLRKTLQFVVAAIVIAVLAVLLFSVHVEPAKQVVSSESDGSKVVIVEAGPSARRAVPTVYTPGDDRLKLVVAGLKANDFVKFGPAKDTTRLEWIEQATATENDKVKTILISALATLLFAWLLLAAAGKDLSALVMGADNRYSNSKVQMTMWFFIVIVAYVAVMALRFVLSGGQLLEGPTVPSHLLMLSGLSALTFAGAKAVTVGKIEREADRLVANGQGAQAGAGGQAPAPAGGPGLAAPAPTLTREMALQEAKGALKPIAARSSLLRDLLCDDKGTVDFGDFQALFITVIAVISYLLQLSAFLGSAKVLSTNTLPDVDSTIVALFGLGQGAYLANKAVGNGA